MEEDASRRTIALSVKASKLTARALAVALAAAGRKIQKAHREAQTPHGKQSVKKLMAHGAATNSIPLDGDTKDFDRVARKWNVDYSFHKAGPDKYLLFFKAGQADAITACFADYSKRVLQKSKTRVSIREQLKRAAELVRQQPQRERTKEAAREDR
ncbi:MAG: PcfB family protein [Oscillospiraceae bacterium]